MSAQEQQATKYLECYGPRIYVACLAAYNNGQLHGRWIKADQDVEPIQSEIADMLAISPIPHAEEYAIHDFEALKGRRLVNTPASKPLPRLLSLLANMGN